MKENGNSGDILQILSDILSNTKQRVVLWTKFILGSRIDPLLFLLYINHLNDDLSSNLKILAHDTPLFWVVYDVNASARELNDDLKKINQQAFQWNMNFNPDPS